MIDRLRRLLFDMAGISGVMTYALIAWRNADGLPYDVRVFGVMFLMSFGLFLVLTMYQMLQDEKVS
jgi:hypothetical protein